MTKRTRLLETTSPRGVTQEELANYLGLSAGTFIRILPKLQKQGFRHKDPILKRYDLKAVDLWFDRRSHLTEDYDPDSDPDLIELDKRLKAYGKQARSERPKRNPG